MAIRTALAAVASLGLACAVCADQAPKLSKIAIDDSAFLPKEETLTKDTRCNDQNKCVYKLDLHLDCRNGVSLRASVVQPIGAQATVISVTNKGKSVSAETLHTINIMLKDRPASFSGRVEVDGVCGSDGAAIYLAVYANAFMKTRHQVGRDIIVRLLTNGQDSVSNGPADEE